MANVLLCEDDPLMSTMYETILDMGGHTITKLLSCENLVEEAMSNNPDLILLDLMMPKVNGLQALEALKVKRETENIPVIVFSNLMDSNIPQQALEKGAARFILKSECTPKRFLEEVNTVLETKTPKSST